MRKILSSLKYLVRYSFSWLLYYSGVSPWLMTHKLKNRIVVLTYHRVMPYSVSRESFSNASIVVDPEVFENQLSFLRKHFDILTMSELATRIESNTESGRPACVITLDDGWIDNYLHAFPVLKKLNLPATIFLPVDYIGTDKLFWQEKMARGIFRLSEQNDQAARDLLQHLNLETLSSLSTDMRKESVLEFIARTKKKPYREIDSLVEKIDTVLQPDPAERHIDRYMDWDQVNEMQKSGVEFGSHCCTHRILTRLEAKTIRHEMSKSAETIETRTGLPRFAIAYPNGDNNDTVQEIAANAGYKLGFGTQTGFLHESRNSLDIRRINVNERQTSRIPLFVLNLLRPR